MGHEPISYGEPVDPTEPAPDPSGVVVPQPERERDLSAPEDTVTDNLADAETVDTTGEDDE